jgi:hypothetical protein
VIRYNLSVLCQRSLIIGKLQSNLLLINIFEHFFQWLYSPLEPWPLLFQFHDHFTDGRTPWANYQLVAGPLPKHRITQTQNKHIHTPNIHALCGIRTHDPSVRASEDTSCHRPRGYCLRHLNISKLQVITLQE